MANTFKYRLVFRISASVSSSSSYWILWEPGAGNDGLNSHLASLSDDGGQVHPPNFRPSPIIDAIRFGLSVSMQQNLVQSLGELSLSVQCDPSNLLSSSKETPTKAVEASMQENLTATQVERVGVVKLGPQPTSKPTSMSKSSQRMRHAKVIKMKYMKLRKLSQTTQTSTRASKGMHVTKLAKPRDFSHPK